MKKLLALVLAFGLSLPLYACGGEPAAEPAETEATAAPTEAVELEEHKLGEAIETDILRITLTKAQLAIKLNSSSSGTLEQIQSGRTTLSGEYFTPEEYDPVNDVGLAYVAAKGHTYVAIEYKADNLDRASVEFDGAFNDQFITVEYNGNTYYEETVYGCESVNGYEWQRYNSGNILLLAGEENYYRGYIDIPTDAADLNDGFALIFSLPSSNGTTEQFKYVVTAEDRAEVQSQEIPLDEAIHLFLEQEGQEYFKNHLEEYTLLTGEEISSLFRQKERWEIEMNLSQGTWSGDYCFEGDSRIKKIHPMVGSWYDDSTWKVEGDTLILNGEDICQVCKVKEGTYLLVKDGEPYAIIN